MLYSFFTVAIDCFFSSKHTKMQSQQLLVTSKQNKPKVLFMQDVPFTEVTLLSPLRTAPDKNVHTGQ